MGDKRKTGKVRSADDATPRPTRQTEASGLSGDMAGGSAAAALASGDFRRELMELLRGDIGGIIKTEIRKALDEELSGLRANVSAVEKNLQSHRQSVATELTKLRGTAMGMEESLSTCSDDVVALKQEVAQLRSFVTSLQLKCEDLESRGRRNNVRIIGVFETHSSSPEAVSELLRKALDLQKAPTIDRSHRTLQPVAANRRARGERPRAIIARLHYFQDCVDVLRRAREKQQIKVGEMTISIFPDFTAQVAKARAAYSDVKKQLRLVDGVRFGVVFPSKFRLTHNNQERFFSTPEEVQTYITDNMSTREATPSETASQEDTVQDDTAEEREIVQGGEQRTPQEDGSPEE